ncbi:MAG: thiamine pyrophosphate-dependent enzyme [Candidatus Acidiferrales bacterium]
MPFGVELQESNLAPVAEAFDAKGIRLEEPGDLENVLAEALAYEDGPVVLDAPAGGEGTAEESPPASRVTDETDYFRLADYTVHWLTPSAIEPVRTKEELEGTTSDSWQ